MILHLTFTFILFIYLFIFLGHGCRGPGIMGIFYGSWLCHAILLSESWYGNKGTRDACSEHSFEKGSRLIITKRAIDQERRGMCVKNQ